MHTHSEQTEPEVISGEQIKNKKLITLRQRLDTLSRLFQRQTYSTTSQIIWYSFLSTLFVLGVISLVIWHNRDRIFSYFANEYVKSVQDGSTATGRAFLSQDSFVVDAVKKTNPAVVAITISKTVPKYQTYYQQYDPFGGIFGGQNPFGGQVFTVPELRQDGTEKKDVGEGSGFLVSSTGLIVTNKHVVLDKDADYTVKLTDGRTFKATVLARDQVLDIALIQIEGTGFPYLELGDSDKINLGQSVIAIGNALGQFQNTVSVGVVSGLSRSLTAGDGEGMSEDLEQVIQTDAAINPGNSGGPLLDLSGHVIGVDVAVAEGSQSVGFALPINAVKSAIDSVRATGKIIRPYLGVRYVAVPDDLKKKNQLADGVGVVVKHGAGTNDDAVISGSPADKAGIIENDIILSVDGVEIDTDHTLAQIIREKKVGDTIALKIISKGVTKTVNVILDSAPADK